MMRLSQSVLRSRGWWVEGGLAIAEIRVFLLQAGEGFDRRIGRNGLRQESRLEHRVEVGLISSIV